MFTSLLVQVYTRFFSKKSKNSENQGIKGKYPDKRMKNYDERY